MRHSPGSLAWSAMYANLLFLIILGVLPLVWCWSVFASISVRIFAKLRLDWFGGNLFLSLRINVMLASEEII